MEEKKRTGKNKRIKRLKLTLIVVTIVLLSVCICEFLVMKYTHLLSGDARKINGVWSYDIDVTEACAANMALWMSDVQGADISVDMIKDSLGIVSVPCELEFCSKDHTWKCDVKQEDYDYIADNVYTAMAGLLEGVILDRIMASEIDLKGTDISSLIKDVIGCDTKEYLYKAVPNLLPAYDQMVLEYSNDGTYSINNGIVTFEKQSGFVFDGAFEIFVDNDTLILHKTEDSTVLSFAKEDR